MGSNPNAELQQNRRDQKRGYQWLMNASEQELLLNKKHAIELVNSNPTGDTANLADYLWCSNEQLVPFDNNYVSTNLEEINFLEKFGNDHSTRSSTSEYQNLVLEPIHSTEGIKSLVPASDNSFTRPYYLGWIQNNMLLYEQTLSRGSGNVRPTGHTYGDDYYFNAINHYYDRAIHFNSFKYLDSTAASLVHSQPSANIVVPLLGNVVNNNERSIVAFGGFNGYNYRKVSPSTSRVISNVYANQDVIGRLNGTYESTLTSRPVDIEEEMRTKKTRNNNFPINAKSLLLTGILDGVPVIYVPWSREKSLRGVIKGPGYMCSCEECKLSKCVTAYEFEIHAGFKTKHPNDHIYFPNGKTVYGAVQELKSMPRDQLFDAIENVTGSPINQENFLRWKALYQAQTAMVQGANMAS